jgi:hypothetical protein
MVAHNLKGSYASYPEIIRIHVNPYISVYSLDQGHTRLQGKSRTLVKEHCSNILG